MNESHKHKIMVLLFKDVKRSKTVDIKSHSISWLGAGYISIFIL